MLKLISDTDWQLVSAESSVRSRRGVASPQPPLPGTPGLPDWMLLDGMIVSEVAEVAAKPSRRTGGGAPLVVEADARPDRSYLTVARHASGALTLHAPAVAVGPADAKSRRGDASRRIRFEITPSQAGMARRRGLIGKAVKLFVVEIADEVARRVLDAVAPRALAVLERNMWGNSPLGFLTVTGQGLLNNHLRLAGEIAPGPEGRALLLVHGTFSSTAGAYKGLVRTGCAALPAFKYGHARLL